MAIYRKIDTRIWNDAKFNALSPNGKLAFLFILTNPGMTAIGAMRATIEGLSAELRVPAEAFREVFGEAFEEALPEGRGNGHEKASGNLAIFDPKACCLYVPNFVKYQAAESPNVIKAWAKTLEYIPECRLKTIAVDGVKAYVEGLGKGFRIAFRKAFEEDLREDMGESVNSEQRAVSNPPTEGVHATGRMDSSQTVREPTIPVNRKRRSHKFPIPTDFEISDRVRRWAAENGYSQLDDHLDAFRRKCQARGYTYADWDAAFMEAVREDWASLRKSALNGKRVPPRDDFSCVDYGKGGRL